MDVLTPGHPRWDEFVERLSGPEGCDFTEEQPQGRCDNTPQRPYATAILESMIGIDVYATLDYLQEEGGFCDCEILFNVAKDG